MLLVKPILLSLIGGGHKKHHADEEVEHKDDNFKAVDAIKDKYDLHDNIVQSAGDVAVHSHAFGELMIHQLIETIEFVLGTVSNTASYLRLWALSLAHSQLAKVFFDNTIVAGLTSGNIVALYIGFFVFMSATFGVLMLMDLIECALHTLRLHWVEFQNKFFKGQGKLFTPVRLEISVLSA